MIRASRARPATGRIAFALAACSYAAGLGEAAGQQPVLTVEREDGSSSNVTVSLDRGFAAVGTDVLTDLGWTVVESGGGLTISAAGEIHVAMRLSSPFFRWDGVVLQMTDAPYRAGRRSYVPLQFLSDFLPRRLPGLYDFADESGRLRAGDVALLATGGASAGVTGGGGESGATPTADLAPTVDAEPALDPNSAEAVRLARPSTYDGTRVVVIDAGHGGEDPGSLSQSGIREKDVALAVALRVAEELRGVEDLEIVMIRDDDTFVDVWERGLIATRAKGERPGLFVSIHANSFPARREARGFETYFLSDARTEHERRVSAIENAPMSRNPASRDSETGEDLDFIFRDLTNYDHAHWSEDLAALVQEELDDFHPGPNRGVKQGVLAVLTNALMPSVLIELGYLSNQAEARVLNESDFHDQAAEAIAEAVVRFFERYPPGNGTGAPEPSR